eukprot:XP_013966005.1 proline-rich protein 36-like [Canis lupus familiaris]
MPPGETLAPHPTPIPTPPQLLRAGSPERRGEREPRPRSPLTSAPASSPSGGTLPAVQPARRSDTCVGPDSRESRGGKVARRRYPGAGGEGRRVHQSSPFCSKSRSRQRGGERRFCQFPVLPGDARRRVGGQPHEISAFTLPEVGRTLGSPSSFRRSDSPSSTQRTKRTPKGLQVSRKNSPPQPPQPPHPPQRCPLGEHCKPQDKAGAGRRRLHPRGYLLLPAQQGSCGDSEAPSHLSVAPTSPAPHCPSPRPRRPGSGDPRAVLRDPRGPALAAAFRPRPSALGSLAAPRLLPPGAPGTLRASPVSVPSPTALPWANQVSRAQNNPRSFARAFTTRSPTSRIGEPPPPSSPRPIPRPSSLLRATALAPWGTPSSARFPPHIQLDLESRRAGRRGGRRKWGAAWGSSFWAREQNPDIPKQTPRLREASGPSRTFPSTLWLSPHLGSWRFARAARGPEGPAGPTASGPGTPSAPSAPGRRGHSAQRTPGCPRREGGRSTRSAPPERAKGLGAGGMRAAGTRDREAGRRREAGALPGLCPAPPASRAQAASPARGWATCAASPGSPGGTTTHHPAPTTQHPAPSTERKQPPPAPVWHISV